MGSEDEVEQSLGRPSVRLMADPSGHTNSPHPSSREGHLSTAQWSSSILLLCRRGFHGPAELGAVNPNAVHDHGQATRFHYFVMSANSFNTQLPKRKKPHLLELLSSERKRTTPCRRVRRPQYQRRTSRHVVLCAANGKYSTASRWSYVARCASAALTRVGVSGVRRNLTPAASNTALPTAAATAAAAASPAPSGRS